MPDRSEQLRLPRVLYVLLAALFVMGIGYILTPAALMAWLFEGSEFSEKAATVIAAFHEDFRAGMYQLWSFVRPLLQLAILLIVIQWFLGRIGIDLNVKSVLFDVNVQSVLAFLIVGTFCLAALVGYSTEGLKELSLVVVGFYFGSRMRPPQTEATPAERPTPPTPDAEAATLSSRQP